MRHQRGSSRCSQHQNRWTRAHGGAALPLRLQSLIPAVLILIIQQTLLLGIGLSAGTARENNRFKDLVPISRQYQGTLRIVGGKSLAYFLIYALVAAYVLCLVPQLFDLVQIAQPMTLLAFVVPYILACIFFAMTCSIFIHHRESCLMIYVFTSVPLLFISGISWPGAAVPTFWKVFSWIFPSTFGINGFVRINNMGATLPEVLVEYQHFGYKLSYISSQPALSTADKSY